ncbi:hypothetical protein IIO_04971 [Bacillus cereus VD115]|nr:hypothetical protein IIO_04971 [Bacillus cereus VD115]
MKYIQFIVFLFCNYKKSSISSLSLRFKNQWFILNSKRLSSAFWKNPALSKKLAPQERLVDVKFVIGS